MITNTDNVNYSKRYSVLEDKIAEVCLNFKVIGQDKRQIWVTLFG